MLYIKNMVCVRCKMAVEAVLNANNIAFHSVELGRAKLMKDLTPGEKADVMKGLRAYELELIEDRNKLLVERIKTEVISLLDAAEPIKLKLSVYLSKALDYNYTYLANIFAEQEGTTLEKYFITQRVEKAKELIVYEDMSLTHITEALAYSSVSHLCMQFKKVAAITPAEFRRRCRLEDYVWRKV